MYRNSKKDFGIGGILYRSTDEIRNDMREVAGAIREIAERLNPRVLLLDIVNDSRCNSPKKLIVALEDVLARAEDSYAEIKNLREELSMLEDELRETLCEMGY